MDLVCMGKNRDLHFDHAKLEKHTKCSSGEADKALGCVFLQVSEAGQFKN